MGTGFWFLQEEMTGDRDKFALLWGEAQLYFALCLLKEKEKNTLPP